MLASPLFSYTFPLRPRVFHGRPLFSIIFPHCSVKKKNSSPRKQTSCPVDKEDSSAAFIPPGLRLRTDLRRRIEKSVRKCPRAPAERTLTMLAYLAPPVKRQSNTSMSHPLSPNLSPRKGRAVLPCGTALPAAERKMEEHGEKFAIARWNSFV